jgi:hypothetical protein
MSWCLWFGGAILALWVLLLALHVARQWFDRW